MAKAFKLKKDITIAVGLLLIVGISLGLILLSDNNNSDDTSNNGNDLNTIHNVDKSNNAATQNYNDDYGLEERINNALFESDQIKEGLQEDIKEIEDILSKDCREILENTDLPNFNTIEALEETLQSWSANTEEIINQANNNGYTSDNLTKLIKIRDNPAIKNELANIESLGSQLIEWLSACL